MMLFVSLLLSTLTGLILTYLLWPPAPTLRQHLAVRICVATGIGIGISSTLFFLWLVVGGYRMPFVSFIIIELVCLGVLTFMVARAAQSAQAPDSSLADPLPCPSRPLCAILTVAAGAGLVGAMLLFYFQAALQPHGGWDAWAIWNMRAEFFFKGGAHWKDAFASALAWSNQDYPVLLPSAVARCWYYMGRDATAGPACIAFLFTFATVGLLYAVVVHLRRKEYGALAALSLLATPFFIIHGAAQYADIPLGFYILATLSLCALHDTLPSPHRSMLALAGIAAGCAAWTKNEGSLFFLSIIAARIIVTVPLHGLKRCARELSSLLAGAAPSLLVVAYFKLFLAPSNRMVGTMDPSRAIAQMLDPARCSMIVAQFGGIVAHFGPALIGTIPLLATFLCITGIRMNQETLERTGTAGIVLGCMISGYFLIYLQSPFDLAWHLNTTIYRLAAQLWPTVIFFFFMLADLPAPRMIPASSHRALDLPSSPTHPQKGASD